MTACNPIRFSKDVSGICFVNLTSNTAQNVAVTQPNFSLTQLNFAFTIQNFGLTQKYFLKITQIFGEFRTNLEVKLKIAFWKLN